MGDRFYAIYDNCDGTVDIYLEPEAPEEMLRVVRGAERIKNIEEDIQNRYAEYSAKAQVIMLV